MKRITLAVALATLAAVVASMPLASVHSDDQAVPIYGIKIPHGYRDWRFISTAHEGGNLNSIGAVLANDIGFKAFREGNAAIPGRHDHRRFAL